VVRIVNGHLSLSLSLSLSRVVVVVVDVIVNPTMESRPLFHSGETSAINSA